MSFALTENKKPLKINALRGFAFACSGVLRRDPELRALEVENEQLRRIIAKQALEIEVKSEHLIKTPIRSKIK
jgi:hypothetical protein